MTVRAMLLGCAGVVTICGLTYVNDAILHQSWLVGTHLPISVFGFLLIFVLLFNPLLRRIGKRFSLTGKEIALILAMTLASCCVPEFGLMHYFSAGLMMPHHFEKTKPGWRDAELLKKLPPNALPDITGREDVARDGFVRGVGTGSNAISFSQVPWDVWAGTLWYWLPAIMALWLALLGFCLMVHRHWSESEHLAYPIANFASELIPSAAGGGHPLFRNRLFWGGMGAVFLLYINNYGCVWFRQMIPIPTQFDFSLLYNAFPSLATAYGGFIFKPAFYFSAIGIAFFLPSDVALSLGLARFLFFLLASAATAYGISLDSGGHLALNHRTFLHAGAYLGLFLGFLYAGRHFYLTVARAAIFPGSANSSLTPHAVWGARLCGVSGIVFAACLVRMGLPLSYALLFALWAFILFAVMGRISAETGVFFLQPYFFPSVIIVAMVGSSSISLEALLLLQLMSMVFAMDPRNSITPFLVNALKVLDSKGGSVGKGGAFCAASLVIALACAVPVTLYFQYNRGVNMTETYASTKVPTLPFEQTLAITMNNAQSDRQPETPSQAVSGWLGSISPSWKHMLSLAIGLGLVMIFAICRMRFAWWPLHPVLFLIWASYAAQILAWSFFVGWIIKMLVMKYGGGRLYHQFKPLMIGIIAGELLGGFVPAIIGGVYYFITGEIPRQYTTMPF